MPYCFKIELKEEIAITKYCLFTGHEWLPKEPTILGGSVARALLNCVHSFWRFLWDARGGIGIFEERI